MFSQIRFLDPANRRSGWLGVELKNKQIQNFAQGQDSWADPLILGPALVDLYSYSGEPGYEERDTLASLAQAAKAGGFGEVGILPICEPVLDQPAVLNLMRQRLQALELVPRFHFWGALTLGAQGQQLSEWGELQRAGVVGFTDGRPLTNLVLLRRALEYMAPLKKTLALVPADLNLRGQGVMREGPDSLRLGLAGDPASSEATAIAQIVALSQDYSTPIHLMRISTQKGVALIAQAKSQNLPITASVSWMHLLSDTEDLAGYDPNFRLSPPLGTPGDRRALIEAVKQGIIDAIAVDHRAYTYEEKTLAFAESPPGAIGLELALPLLWQRLVEAEELTDLELWQALSSKPAQCLGIPFKSHHWLVFDPHHTWIANSQTLKTLGQNSPWWGKEIRGKVVQFFEATPPLPPIEPWG